MKIEASRESMLVLFRKTKPFLGVIFLQAGLAGMDTISKVALNRGMSNYVYVVYRQFVATLVIAPFALVFDRKIRPKMTVPVFAKIMLLSLLEPVMDQNLYFLGLKYTTATFAAALANVLPAITFVMAWFCRLEKVKMMSIRSQAKIVGTLATVAGAMIMTLVQGPHINLPWTRGSGNNSNAHNHGELHLHQSIKGAVMIVIAMLCCSCFMILQTVTLKAYPAELSLTAWMCLLATVEGAALALVMESGNAKAWAIKWDTSILAAIYSGIICSGISYYVQAVVVKERGPVFVTAFNPLSMVIVAFLSSFILAEQMFLGRLLGAVVIVAGLYFVVWGKKNDHKLSLNENPELPVKNHTTKEENINGLSKLEGVNIDLTGKESSKESESERHAVNSASMR